jgi:putative Mg2+ transporter-C (MgtC) family protein
MAAVPGAPSEAELCLRLLYAACCGAFVGLERRPPFSSSSSSSRGSDRRRRPASAIGGVRTMALVGLGAAAYTACSIHGFVPHAALGVEVGSPILASVKVDISRMASNVASGVGFIGAGCIHKARLRGGGDGTDDDDDRNAAAAGLATAAAVWVSAAAGVASGAGLYGVAAATTLATVAILGYAPRGPEDGEGDVVVDERRRRTRTALVDAGGDRLLDDGGGRSRQRRKRRSTGRDQGSVASGLFGKRGDMGNDYKAENNASYVDQYALYDRYSRDIHPIIIKEIIDPRFERYLGLVSRLGDNDADGIAAADDRRRGRPAESSSNVLLEEEQAVISPRDVAESGQDTFEVEG